MLGLVDLELYNPFFNLTEENNKLQLYKFPVENSGSITYEKVRDESEETWIFRNKEILQLPI